MKSENSALFGVLLFIWLWHNNWRGLRCGGNRGFRELGELFFRSAALFGSDSNHFSHGTECTSSGNSSSFQRTIDSFHSCSQQWSVNLIRSRSDGQGEKSTLFLQTPLLATLRVNNIHLQCQAKEGTQNQNATSGHLVVACRHCRHWATNNGFNRSPSINQTCYNLIGSSRPRNPGKECYVAYRCCIWTPHGRHWPINDDDLEIKRFYSLIGCWCDAKYSEFMY